MNTIQIAMDIFESLHVGIQSFVQRLAAATLPNHASALVDQPCSCFMDHRFCFQMDLRIVQLNTDEGNITSLLVEPMAHGGTLQSVLPETLGNRNANERIEVADRLGNRHGDFVPNRPAVSDWLDFADSDRHDDGRAGIK